MLWKKTPLLSSLLVSCWPEPTGTSVSWFNAQGIKRMQINYFGLAPRVTCSPCSILKPPKPMSLLWWETLPCPRRRTPTPAPPPGVCGKSTVTETSGCPTSLPTTSVSVHFRVHFISYVEILHKRCNTFTIGCCSFDLYNSISRSSHHPARSWLLRRNHLHPLLPAPEWEGLPQHWVSQRVSLNLNNIIKQMKHYYFM